MKHRTVIFAFVLILLTLSAPVYAARPVFTAEHQATSARNQFRIRPTVTPGDDTREASGGRQIRANLRQQWAERRMAVRDRILSIFKKRLERYLEFLSKVESRRDKLKETGKDVTKLDAFISTAKNLATTTGDTIDAAETALENVDYTTDTASVIETVHEEFTKVRQAFQTMHTAMSQTVKEIKQQSQ